MDALRCIDESTIEDDQTSDVDQNDKSAPLSHSALSGAAEDSSRLSSGGAETFVDERSLVDIFIDQEFSFATALASVFGSGTRIATRGGGR